jgi:hypothetical protein
MTNEAFLPKTVGSAPDLGLYLVIIVGIVAIVAIVALVLDRRFKARASTSEVELTNEPK